MATSGVKLLLIGKDVQGLPYEVERLGDSKSILSTIARFSPDVIVTLGVVSSALNVAAFDIRKKWIDLPVDSSAESIINVVEYCYNYNIWTEAKNQRHNPLISVYTPTYNTGDYIQDTYLSLKEQTYTNWEWVVVDDFSEDGTWERLLTISREDIRVRPFRSGRPLRKIGAVKDTATRLAKGKYLVELDHDDMLTDTALMEIKDAFVANPTAGMVYSNWAEFYENGQPHRYEGDFWKDRYRETEYRGKKYAECLVPDIYESFGPKFTDCHGWHLTTGPNHVRAYRAETLFKLGGYNPDIPVADDWDLFVRFFMRSVCCRIDKMLYLYRFLDGGINTTFTRNKSIRDHLALARIHHKDEFVKFHAMLPKPGNAPGTEEKPCRTLAQDAKPLVSVIIPTYKRPELLRKAVDSALAQDYGNIEIVIVGDNCPDVMNFDTKGDPRISIHNLSENHDDWGGSPKNHALGLAKGKLIAYLDDDNEWTPDHVSSIVSAMISAEAAYGFSSMSVKGKDLGFTEPKLGGIDCSCVIHDRTLIDKYGLWSTNGKAVYANDWDMYGRWVDGKEPWVFTRKPTLIYNVETSGQAQFLAEAVKSSDCLKA